MELLVEVVHGDTATDVALEVEPGATFGDVADALAFLAPRPRRRHAERRPHRPDARAATTGSPTSTCAPATG